MSYRPAHKPAYVQVLENAAGKVDELWVAAVATIDCSELRQLPYDYVRGPNAYGSLVYLHPGYGRSGRFACHWDYPYYGVPLGLCR